MTTPDALNIAQLGDSYVKVGDVVLRDETRATVSSAFHHATPSALDRARRRWSVVAVVPRCGRG
jgi:hypothetical protein